MYTCNRHARGYYRVEFTPSPCILQENKTIYGKVFDSCSLVSNGRYSSPDISHSINYDTPRDENLETIISLRYFIQSDILVSKTRYISKLPSFIKIIKE